METKMSKDPFDNLILDKEEQAIEDALESGEYITDPDLKSQRISLKMRLSNI
jgi:hypothetical protein